MEMDKDENDKVIVRTIIDLAHNLGLTVVAEGVETKTSLALLSTLGCNVAQGFLIGKPVPDVDFNKSLQKETKVQKHAKTKHSQNQHMHTNLPTNN